MSAHADQVAALKRLQEFLDATADLPGSGCPLYSVRDEIGVSFRILRLVADLADARSDAL